MTKTWKELTSEQLTEVVDALPFDGDIYNLINNEERDIRDAVWTYLDRNPYREKEINETVNILFG